MASPKGEAAGEDLSLRPDSRPQSLAEVHQRLCAESFSFLSLNLCPQVLDWEPLWSQLKSLSGFELWVLLPRPEGLVVIRPEKPEERVPLVPYELVLLYLRAQEPHWAPKMPALLAQIEALLRRRRPLNLQSLSDEPAPSGWVVPPKRLENKSPLHSVEVKNELFHHANLEALARVLRDYEETYPLLKVRLFHDGEPVHELYSLFQWGRVRFGDRIYFRVEGPAFSEISRLKMLLGRACGPNCASLLETGQRYFR